MPQRAQRSHTLGASCRASPHTVKHQVTTRTSSKRIHARLTLALPIQTQKHEYAQRRHARKHRRRYALAEARLNHPRAHQRHVRTITQVHHAALAAETIALHYLVDAAAKSGDDKHMWKYVQQFRYDDDEKDSIEEHIFSQAASPAGKRALLARIRLRSEPDITTSLCPTIRAASTNRLIEAAGRWRNEITARETNGNTLWESDARIAHALVCCELAGRNHITASDLAELIETMSGQRTFHDLTLNTPRGRQHVTNVEELIDAASPHMTR